MQEDVGLYLLVPARCARERFPAGVAWHPCMSTLMSVSQHKLSPFYFCLLHTLSQRAPWFITSLMQTHLERPTVGIVEVILFSCWLRGQNVNVVENTGMIRVLEFWPLSVPTTSCLIQYGFQGLTFLWEFVTSPTMPFSSLYFLAQCLAESSETWTEPWSSGPVLSLRTFCRDGMFRICALTGGSWTFESWLVWLSNRLLHFI